MPYKNKEKANEYLRNWRKRNPHKSQEYYKKSLLKPAKPITEERRQYMKVYLARWREENQNKILEYRGRYT